MQFHLSSHGADDQREERRTPEIRVPAPAHFFPRTEKGGCTSPGKSRRRHAFTCREKCGSIPAGGGKNTDAFRRRVYAAYRCGFALGVAVAPGVARRCRVLCGLVSLLFALRGSVTGGAIAGRGPACLVAWTRRGSCRGLRHAFDVQRALRGIRPRYRTPPVARRFAVDARLAFGSNDQRERGASFVRGGCGAALQP